jgi:hypothetical protein
MIKSQSERKAELTRLIQAETPSWLTKGVYNKYLETFDYHQTKIKKQFYTFVQDICEKDCSNLIPNPQWGFIDVKVTARVLVKLYQEGRIISPPSTGQDPKSYNLTNVQTASEHFANNWGNDDGSFWLRDGVVNLVVYPNGNLVFEATDIEHRLWGIIGGALDLVKLKSDKKLFFKSYKIRRPLDPNDESAGFVDYIEVNDMYISDIVETANKYTTTNELVTKVDVLERYYEGLFNLRILPMYSAKDCHHFYKVLNKMQNKTIAQLLHADTNESTSWLKTFSSIKLERFKAADYKLHPFLNLYPDEKKISLETFMVAHLVTQYTIDGKFVDSTDGKLKDVIQSTFGYQYKFDEDLKESVLNKFDILYELFSKIENPKLSRQYILQFLEIYKWVQNENMVICDNDIFANTLYNFIETQRIHPELNSDGTKNDNAGTKTRFGVFMGASNKNDYLDAFSYIKKEFLYNALTNESYGLTIGLCKKSNRVPRLFSNEIIIDSFNKQKGLDLDNTEIEGNPVGGHIISDSELIRMTDTERVEAFKSENLGDKFKFELNCRAMSSYHNLRMSVLRLSEYLEIINEPDSVVRKRVNEKREYLKSKPILV